MTQVRPRSSLALCAFATTAALAASSQITPQLVFQWVALFGAKGTLQMIYDDQAQWTALLSGIATGTTSWLRVANRLYAVSDAGSTEQLGLAVGKALEHRPSAVLKLAVPTFTVETVCGGPDVDDARYNSYEHSIAAIDQREAKLRFVTDPSLTSVRDSCISVLEQAKADIAHFYGHGE